VSTPVYEFRVLGAEATPLRDLYHALLRHSWLVTFAFISGNFLAANALFAGIYVLTGGISNAHPGSFLDAFYFSVQTMGTIGYGVMAPETPLANGFVVLESIVSVILTALATGLVFAKFSRPTARVQFSRQVAISRMDGVPTLAFRIGNIRGNNIVDAQIHLSMVRTERTKENHTFYRTLDLALARERMTTLTRSWTALHVLDDKSPLAGATAASLERDEVELQVLVVGLDDTSMQQIHATHRYMASDIVFGARLADVLSEAADGALVLDLRRFHELEPAE
jgi:inward rectifier potassium channel